MEKILDIYTLDKKNIDEVSMFLKQNIGLVVDIAKRFNFIAEDYEDLLQEGSLALYQSIMNFDTTTGYKFSTYAFPVIYGSMQNYVRNKKNAIRIPRSIYNTFFEYLKLLNEYEKDEALDLLNLSEKDRKLLEETYLQFNMVSISIDISHDNQGNISLVETIADDCDVEKEATEGVMYQEIMELIQRKVGDRGVEIAEYLAKGLTITEIAKKMGISRAYIYVVINKVKDVCKNMKYI